MIQLAELFQLHYLVLFFFAVVVLAPTEASARDWFVRAGAPEGDGSAAKPFADPWQALEKVQAGDAVHVAAGKYFGRLGLGTWALPFDGVQLIGGYDKDFKTRDPWANPTHLLWDKTSKNWPKESRLTSNAKNTVVDGVVIDMRDQNQYTDDDPMSGRTEKPGETAMRFTQPVTVRNSVILNPGANGIECVPGSTIENNLVLNAVGWGVSVYTSGGNFEKMVATIRNNTILFSVDIRKPGAGGYAGAAVSLNGPALVTNNILAHSDNNAIYITHKAEKEQITKNLFHLNLFSNVKFYVDGRDLPIDDKNMDLMEEAGFKAFDGNEIKNPTLDLDPKWMDAFSRRTSATEGKVEMTDWNEMRKTLGLPMMGKGGESAKGAAPPWEYDKALKLLQPKSAAIKQGARHAKLEVKLQGAVEKGPAKSYAPVDFFSWNKAPEGVDGKSVEMVVALGSVANIGGIPAQYAANDHSGIVIYDKDGKGERVTGFFKKGTTPERICNEAMGNYQGQGVPQRLFTVRGTAHVVKNLPKAGMFIESIEPFVAGASAVAHAAGRDWFVVAGAAGGDGSREKPFKDPFQALEKSEAGDMIHVAEGEYFGKLRAGNWSIDTTNIALIGGYAKDFKTRNPWKHPTFLHTAGPADFKGRRGGYTIEGGKNDHSGAIVDGFVFDKKLNNLYTETGDLDYSRSDKTEHIWLARPGCIIRNNVFLNGAEGAVRLGGAGQFVENNIFINHWTKTVNAEGGFGNEPFVFRHNTVLFAWDMRFGNGKGSNGNLLILGGGLRAQVDANIFQFADNDAIRLNALAKDVELTNNVFSHNLWSNVQKPEGWVSIDDKEWAKLADFGWKKLEGNQVVNPALPIDEKWFALYLGRTAFTPGKVKMDDWNQLREVLGQPVIATGGKAGTGMAPAYDSAKALALFPKNAKVTAGARASDQPVKFTGVTRVTESHEYEEVSWDVAKNKDAWEKLDGKRVMLRVVIRDTDNQYFLDDVKVADFQCFTAAGPEGTDSGGLPLRAYVKKGTVAERSVKGAKGYSSGTPAETHLLKGIARGNRQLVTEVVEKGD